MSNTMMMKLTNYEKKALRSFGCPDKGMTVNCLFTVAHMAIHEEDREKLIRLAEKVRNDLFPGDYKNDYYENASALEDELVHKTLAYAEDTDDPFPGKPWKNYLEAQIVNGFCNEDHEASLFRLRQVAEVSVPSCMRDCLMDVLDIVTGIPIWGPDRNEYGEYLTKCREIVHTGVNRKKKGREKYYSYVWKEVADEQTETDEV